MAWSDVLKAVIPIVVAALAWLLGQVASFSERLTKIEGSMCGADGQKYVTMAGW